MHRDRLQHAEEVGSVLGKLLKVFVDHFQCALKQSVHDWRNVVCCQCLATEREAENEDEIIRRF